jgi:hypothetical protein
MHLIYNIHAYWQTRTFRKYPVALTEKDLLSLLDSTGVIVSEQKQSLLGLIELGSSATNKEEFVTEILKRAHGSFALSLIIFQHALERHLVLYRDQNDPAYSLLQENDFR